MKTLPGMECAHSALGPKLRGLASGRLVRKVYMRTKRNVMGNLDLLELEFRARYYVADCCIINGSAIRASGMRKNDINLADLTPAGCLLVLVTVALVLVSVVWTVSMLPEEWARFIPKHATAIPVALLGMLFFWVCARILGPLGFRIRRSRGEPKIVAISFGFLLLLIGITSLLLPVVLLAGFRTDLRRGDAGAARVRWIRVPRAWGYAHTQGDHHPAG